MTTLLSFIIVLGILVLVHEWGHFAVARLCGVRVETFSIGFGPRILSFQRGDTEYQIALIPLGGYVKMAGDDPGGEGANAPDAFFAQSRPRRAAIVLAGPAMNLLLAFALAPVIYLVGVPEPIYWEEAPVVGWVEPPEAGQGVVAGSQILEVNGETIEHWRGLQMALLLNQGEVRLRLVDAQGAPTEAVIHQAEPGAMLAVLHPPMEAAVDRVMDGSAAARAGIRSGDILLSIDDRPIRHWLEIRHALDLAAGRPVSAEVLREGGVVALEVTAERDPADERWLLGIARREAQELRHYGFAEAMVRGPERVVEMIVLTGRVVRDLFTGRLGLDALGGPVMIAQGAGDAARAGLGAFLTFMVFISVQLGLLNLLPIPVLDGGHLVILAVEGVLRRPVPERLVIFLQWLGLALLIFLMLYVTRNDIMRLWGDAIRRLIGAG